MQGNGQLHTRTVLATGKMSWYLFYSGCVGPRANLEVTARGGVQFWLGIELVRSTDRSDGVGKLQEYKMVLQYSFFPLSILLRLILQ
jgi:hypothetical protein